MERDSTSTAFTSLSEIISSLRALQQRPFSASEYFQARLRGDTVIVNRDVPTRELSEQKQLHSSTAYSNNAVPSSVTGTLPNEDVSAYLRRTSDASYRQTLAALGVLQEGRQLPALMAKSQFVVLPSAATPISVGVNRCDSTVETEAFLAEYSSVAYAKHRLRVARLRQHVSSLAQKSNSEERVPMVTLRTPVVSTALVMHKPLRQ